MKKRLAALLLALVLVLSACGGQTKPAESGSKDTGEKKPEAGTDSKAPEAGKDGKEIADRELTFPLDSELESMDYVVTDKNPDLRFNANFIDGLLENDQTGKIVGSVAEKWEGNADKTVWKFTLRDGVKWFTSTKEEWPEAVTAEDFVTGLRHGADFQSGTSWLLEGVIKGYHEYLQSDKSDAEWEKVGVKALDEKTVEYTMEKPVPYFDSMATYSVLYPINKTFLESKGEGCKLGSPNKDTCDFGQVASDSILYNGAFFLTQHDAKSQTVMEKNQNYWDAKNIHLSQIKVIFDDGSDPYSAINGFEQGIYSSASLKPNWKDYNTYAEKYKDNVFNSLPNSSTFGVIFNFNRQSFNLTNYASDETLKNNTRKAVLNENFRKALRAALDVEAYLGVNTTEEVAKSSVRNINNFPGAGTGKNGSYFELVQKAYDATAEKQVKLEDGQYPWLSKEDALAYIEKAKAEGIEFPIHLDYPVIETRKDLVDKASSIKDSVNKNTDGQIIIEPILKDKDTITAVTFLIEDPATADYDISTFSGWGPDFADPKSFVDTYSGKNGSYLKNMGLASEEPGKEDPDAQIKETVGITEFTKLIEEADKITDNMDARYEAYAKADAMLINKAFFIPTSQQTRGQMVSKIVPFSRIFSDYGASTEKYKGLQLQDDIVTSEQYQKAFDEWTKARSNAAK